MSVSLQNPLTTPDWDALLSANPNATFFHTAAWSRVLHETYGFTPVYFVRTTTAGSRDILPMMEVETWATPRRGVCLPFTDACSPLSATREAAADLLSALQSHADRRAWKCWELRGGREWLPDATASTSYYTHSLDLRPGGAEALFLRAASATRRAVRKAQNSGVGVQFSESIDAVRTFFALHCRTRRKLGSPPQPFRFFEKIHEHVIARQSGSVVLALHAGTPIAGAIYFLGSNTVHYKFGASDERFQQLRGNNLVMWSAIQRYAGLGFESLDFGRTSLTNEGLRQFKSSWGSTEQRLDYIKYDCRRRTFITQPDRAAAGLPTHIFRTLPLPLLRLAGRLLYKHAA